MLLSGLDFETSGLTIGKVGVTEVGIVLWDTDLRAPIKIDGYLVDPGSDAVWEPGVEKINGLTPEICTKYGIQDDKALRQFLFWYKMADVAVAHNGSVFDRLILKHWAEKYGLDWQSDKLWIDTKCDLDVPAHNSTRLTYMAADHNFLNPFPHRAMFDVMTMMKVLDSYDLNQVLTVAKSPTLTVRAMVNYETRELAKSRGYHWQADTKIWTMSVKECFLEREREASKFSIEVIR